MAIRFFETVVAVNQLNPLSIVDVVIQFGKRENFYEELRNDLSKFFCRMPCHGRLCSNVIYLNSSQEPSPQ
jgi:hypothetical protein